MTTERRINVEWLIVAVNGVTLVSVIGAWLWWGGRFSQRMDTVEAQSKAQADAIETLRGTAGKQSSDIAVAQAQYQTILNQLHAINSKLDADWRRK